MSRNGITGIILAGGKSSRMGTSKGIMKINGKTFVENILHALTPVVDSVLIIANDPVYKKFGPVYEDIIKGCGPMGGIYTGLMNSPTKKNIVVSCDIPFITAQMLSFIKNKSGDAEIAVPEHRGELEPLCAVYTKDCADRFRQLLETGEFKMHEALKYFDFKRIIVPEREKCERNFININTPQEFQMANKQMV